MTANVTLGQLVITTGVVEWMHQDFPRIRWVADILHRHGHGDWGDLDAEDRRTNDRALRLGGRLLSAYHYDDGTKVWIITETDRSVTTVLFPEDY